MSARASLRSSRMNIYRVLLEREIAYRVRLALACVCAYVQTQIFVKEVCWLGENGKTKREFNATYLLD